MPIPTTNDQISRNGHYHDDQIISEELDDAAPLVQAPGSLSDDWSAVTQELIDTLPRVWTRGLLYVVVLFTGVVLPWAVFAKVDVTGSARGRLEPKGRTLRIDAPVSGTVAAIKVKEGETVKAGQVLLELDTELTRTELQQAQAQLEGQLNRIPQLQLMQNQLEIAIRAQKLQSQAQQSAQSAQIDAARQKLNFSRNAYAIAKERRDRDLVEVQRYSSLQQAGVIPPIQVVEVRRSLAESQRLLNQAQSDAKQAELEIKQQQSNYDNVVRTGELTTLESERRIKEIQAQIVDIQAEVTQTQKQIQSAQLQLQQRTLRAPIDGTIFQVSIENAGSVIQPGKTIAQLAPKGVPTVFRAQIPSQDSGFLRVGMPVKLKFDAYPFQEYGVVPAHLTWMAPDSKIVETQGNDETFELEITLAQTYIQNQNQRIPLTPGQTATAEVIVRQRRIIDFLLDPFKKLQKSGLEL